jgi:transcriptional regulator with XRE-family HTH domain
MESKRAFNIFLGSKIKEKRLALGLTREKLADMAQISDKFIYDIEVGNKGISAWTLRKISLALGVRIDCLINEEQIV